MNQKLSEIFQFSRDTIKRYREDRVSKFAASLTYYTIFSIAPIILIVVNVAGIFYRRESVQGEITAKLSSFIKPETASVIESAVKNTGDMGSGFLNIGIGVLVLIIGSTTVFMDLQDSLNRIWRVKKKPNSGALEVVKSRLTAFFIVIAAGFLLLISFLITSLIPVLQELITQYIPVPEFILNLVGYIISFSVVFALFLMIFKVLPDVELTARDVITGTLLTSILFVFGQFLISLFLNSTAVGEKFGPAGALIGLLIWVYYTAQIIYLGAEVTYSYASQYGSGIQPNHHAVLWENPPEKDESTADSAS